MPRHTAVPETEGGKKPRCGRSTPTSPGLASAEPPVGGGSQAAFFFFGSSFITRSAKRVSAGMVVGRRRRGS